MTNLLLVGRYVALSFANVGNQAIFKLLMILCVLLHCLFHGVLLLLLQILAILGL